VSAIAVSTSCDESLPPAASPTPTPTPTPTPITMTITADAVTPSVVTIAAGRTVTFINNDSANHDIESNPHPVHTDCPEINQVGLLTPGQSKATAALSTVRTCGFHDHLNSRATAWQGTITIQ
jgi:plastocyanin